MKLILVRYPESVIETDIELLRDEFKQALNKCEDSGIGVALIRSDIDVNILDLIEDEKYIDD